MFDAGRPAEAALIRDLATQTSKRDLFDRLHRHFSRLADEVEEIGEALAAATGKILTVGFNRRFSPAATAVRQFFTGVTAPLTVSIRFNVGAIPAEHWTQDEDVGGGRLVGEACHAIDLATFLVGHLLAPLGHGGTLSGALGATGGNSRRG